MVGCCRNSGPDTTYPRNRPEREVPMKRMSFGHALKVARERAGFTQGRLAEVTGNSVSTISSWERGEHSPSWTTIEVLLDALGLSFHDFAGIVEEKDAPAAPQETFVVDFYDAAPQDPTALPSPTVRLPLAKGGFWSTILHLPEVSDRFIWSRVLLDEMIPDFYPGDLVFIDTATTKPRARQLVAGFSVEGDPQIRQYVREQGEEKLVAGNRHYPDQPFEGFLVKGRVFAAMRFFK